MMVCGVMIVLVFFGVVVECGVLIELMVVMLCKCVCVVVCCKMLCVDDDDDEVCLMMMIECVFM